MKKISRRFWNKRFEGLENKPSSYYGYIPIQYNRYLGENHLIIKHKLWFKLSLTLLFPLFIVIGILIEGVREVFPRYFIELKDLWVREYVDKYNVSKEFKDGYIKTM